MNKESSHRGYRYIAIGARLLLMSSEYGIYVNFYVLVALIFC